MKLNSLQATNNKIHMLISGLSRTDNITANFKFNILNHVQYIYLQYYVCP